MVRASQTRRNQHPGERPGFYLYGVKPLDLAPHHPVRLNHVHYLQFAFERLDLADEGIRFFPDFDVIVQESQVYEQANGLLVLTVTSTDTVPDDIVQAVKAEGEENPRPSVRFSVTMVVSFTCTPVDNVEQLMTSFMQTETPILIAWPYLRAFLGDMIERSGLPSYHLPLLQIRTQANAQEPVAPTTDVE